MAAMTLLWVAACAGPTPLDDTATATGETGEPDTDTPGETADTPEETANSGETDEDDEEDEAYRAFYAPDAVQAIYLTVGADEQAELLADGTEYVSCTFTHDQTTLEDVGSASRAPRPGCRGTRSPRSRCA